MPSKAETTIHSRMLKPLALLALAAVACAGLAGCGGGSGGGDQVMIVPSPSGGSPDLVVEPPSVSDPAPAAGANFTLSATARNAGDGNASAATVRFYRSLDETITPSDTQVGAVSVGELAAAGSGAASVELSAPSIPGTYYYGACADAVDGESDTANNCSTVVQVTAPGSRPDLVVASLSVSDANPIAGADITFSATVRNDGNGKAAAVRVRFYRSDDAAITTSDEEVGDATVAELAASESEVASVTLVAPSTPGTYHYGACADAADGESEAANNCSASVRITVSAPEPQAPAFESLIPVPVSARPDLVVESPSVGNPDPVAGARFGFQATVRNAGVGTAAAATLHVYRSLDETITPSDHKVTTRPPRIRALAASETSYQSLRLQTPWRSGTYYYGACVDPVARESDTANNCSAAVPVTVPPHLPDLVVESPSVSHDSPAIGGFFALWATVRNAGDKLALVESTTLRFYRSDDATFTASDPQVAVVRRGRLDWNQLSYRAWTYFLKAPTSMGDYYYRACVDAVARESDTTNNCSGSVKIDLTHNKPNLRIVTWSFPYSVSPGASFKLAAQITNLGGTSAATTLRAYLLPDQTSLPSSGTEVGVVAVPPLVTRQEDAKLSKGFKGNIWPTAPSTPGRHYYALCVDAVPDESDTTDNCKRGFHVRVVER